MAQALVILGAAGALAWFAVSSQGDVPARTTTTSSTPPTSAVTSTTHPGGAQVEQSGWTAVTRSHGAIVVDRRSYTFADGNVVTVFRFRANAVRFALHTGSSDPPGAAAVAGVQGGPQISASEAPHVVAAFNGGFKVASQSGGFELNGRVIVPLRAGFASLVIDANGSARIGVWGAGLPRRGEQVLSVRQNLQPLIAGGTLSATVNDVPAWGDPLGGVPQVARSALGEDTAGNLIYAASMHALPLDVGAALLHAGAVHAMEMDINPYWVQLESTPHPGGSLVPGIPSQNRPGDQYQLGWTRDFVTVMAVAH